MFLVEMSLDDHTHRIKLYISNILHDKLPASDLRRTRSQSAFKKPFHIIVFLKEKPEFPAFQITTLI